MEIKKSTETINQYWLKTVAKINLIATLIGFLQTLIVGLTIFFFFLGDYNPLVFWLGLLVLAIVFITINTLALNSLSRPLKDLLAVASKINNDENTSLTPPNVNNKKYRNTGFATAVSALYDRAVKEAPSANDNSEFSNIIDGINRANCQIITLDTDGHITYYNQGSPIKSESNGEKVMSLLFNGQDNFNDWLNHVKEHTVNAEKVWKRVSDQVAGQEDRRIFDVYANFKKNSINETVITLVDRTSDYSSDEEALDFIAFAAHELRGPITVIRGYIDVLHEELDGILVDDQAELFKRLDVSASKLSGYINNILNTSRYDRRHLKVKLEKDSFANIYKSIADDMQLRATSQGRMIEVMISTDLPCIAADRNSISEVMSNLIDNAIKYSNEGGLVSVTAKQTGDMVDLIVTDRGIGMPGNVVANLFQKFYRSHRSRETVAGTGIGLYISKAIVESHGGNIAVASEEGKGSVFTVSLPTYESISAKLTENKDNEDIIKEGSGWIKNHGMYRG